MSNTITIGALRLVGEPSAVDGFYRVSVKSSDSGCGAGFPITAAEWASLESVAAVVEAAKEFREAKRTLHYVGDCGNAIARLVDAIDSLDTSSRGSK